MITGMKNSEEKYVFYVENETILPTVKVFAVFLCGEVKMLSEQLGLSD